MKQEKSCGCVVIEEDKVLLIKHVKGHWDIPKGHMEEGETEQETAIRELKEETNLEVEIIAKDTYELAYSPEEGIWKQVVYFLAKKTGGEIQPQITEVQEVRWFPMEEAIQVLTFDNAKQILQKIIEKNLFKR